MESDVSVFLVVPDHVGWRGPGAVRQVDPVSGVEAIVGRETGGDVGQAYLGQFIGSANQRRPLTGSDWLL